MRPGCWGSTLGDIQRALASRVSPLPGPTGMGVRKPLVSYSVTETLPSQELRNKICGTKCRVVLSRGGLSPPSESFKIQCQSKARWPYKVQDAVQTLNFRQFLLLSKYYIRYNHTKLIHYLFAIPIQLLWGRG
jgi:hypothetical protein